MINKLKKILFFFVLYISLGVVCGQNIFNPNPIKKLYSERFNFSQNRTISLYQNRQNQFHFILNQYFYLNTNLPNLENQNGFYSPRGIGSVTGVLFQYHGKYLTLSAEPRISDVFEYANSVPNKEIYFSKLNDVPLEDT
ncbi:uncharacterized protein METZ01_LOCUS464897, partial [marine metagenome]